MDRIWNDAKDMNVANFVVYGKAADSKLYYESSYTTQVKTADAEEAFEKGRLVIKVTAGYLVPLGIASNKVLTAAMSGSPAAIAGTEWATAAE